MTVGWHQGTLDGLASPHGAPAVAWVRSCTPWDANSPGELGENVIIPPGFVAFEVPIVHIATQRKAFITGGVDNNSGLTDPQAIANGIQNVITTTGGLHTRLDSECTIGPVEVAIGQDGDPPILGIASTTVGGTAVGSVVTPNVAVLIKKRTALGGRKNQGRWFLPWCLPENAVDEIGLISGSTVNGLQAAMNAVLAAATSANLPFVILHRTDPGVPPQVTALTVDNLVATQRRRLGRR